MDSTVKGTDVVLRRWGAERGRKGGGKGEGRGRKERDGERRKERVRVAREEKEEEENQSHTCGVRTTQQSQEVI